MELQGLTPVDTIYEFVGHAVGLRLGTYLIWNGYIVSFVLAAAFLRIYYVCSREGSFTELAIYPIYAFFMFFLLYPIDIGISAPGKEGFSPGSESVGVRTSQTVRVPRVLAYVCALTDALQQHLIRDFKSMIGNTMHEWERIAAINEKTRIMDSGARLDYATYTRYCYWPTMTLEGHPEGDPWELVPLADLPIDSWLLPKYQEIELAAPQARLWGGGRPIGCADLHEKLKDHIARELRTDKFHQTALVGLTDVNVTDSDALAFYRRRILYNETFVVAGVEGGAIREALPEYSLTKGAGWDTTYMGTNVTQSSSVWDTLKNFFGNLPTVAISVASAVSEWWSQKAMGPATYFRVSSLGPHIYGMVIGILFMLFPIAGVMAFWPKWWSAVINFMKLFLSVKLWPILWAFLSAILSNRNVFDGTNPNGYQSGMGTSGVFPAICSMYLLVPMLSFMIVNIAHHAGGAMLGFVIGGSDGASLGEAQGMGGNVVRGAGNVARGGFNVGKWIHGKMRAGNGGADND